MTYYLQNQNWSESRFCNVQWLVGTTCDKYACGSDDKNNDGNGNGNDLLCVRIDGRVTGRDRQRIIDEFNQPVEDIDEDETFTKLETGYEQLMRGCVCVCVCWRWTWRTTRCRPFFSKPPTSGYLCVGVLCGLNLRPGFSLPETLLLLLFEKLL